MPRSSPDSSRLRAGAAEVDISPPLGTHLAGAIHLYRPAEELLDPLFAKALVLEADGRRATVVVLDVLIGAERYIEEIRQMVARRYGFDPDAVLIHATQTHTSPALGHFMLSEEYFDLPREWTWLRGGDDAFHARAVEGAVEAVGRAVAVLEPVQIGMGSGVEG